MTDKNGEVYRRETRVEGGYYGEPTRRVTLLWHKLSIGWELVAQADGYRTDDYMLSLVDAEPVGTW